MKIKILVAIDLSPASARVVQVTERIARGMSGAAWVLHVAEAEPDLVGFDAGPKVVRDQVAKEFREEHKQVQQYADQLRDAGIDATALLVRGPIVDTVLQEAKRLEADLIIVGSHGFGALYDLLVGSESRGIMKKTELPVLVVPVNDDDETSEG